MNVVDVSLAPPPARSEGMVTRWLRTAPPTVFALYGGLSAFLAYSAMYAYRKPFTAAEFAHVPGWTAAIDFKVALVIAQVIGYALSKFIGIKVVSEFRPQHRAAGILVLVGLAEVALTVFAVAPPVVGLIALFANGLCLGMIWGLVFGFLEGRRLSEVLGAMLCASFILASGVVKSVGSALMLGGWASEHWMPATTGLVFAPLLIVSVWALAQLPPPTPEDERERTRRVPMNGADRAAFFRTHAPALIALIIVYVLLTAFRDFRDNFAAEIWRELGYAGEAAIFTWSELPVAIVVLTALGLLIRVRDNARALMWNLGLTAIGLVLTGACTLLFQLGLLNPIAWMILVGAGLYLAYTPFNGLLFDRMMAATASAGNAGFLIYVADSCGYAGSVALLLIRTFAHLSLRWSSFLCLTAYALCGIGCVALALAAVLLRRQIPASG
jgi:hypothetical protein